MKEITTQLKILTIEVTQLRNQNFYAQSNNQNLKNQAYRTPKQPRPWNTQPNNGGVSTPLDNNNPTNERSMLKVNLANLVMNNWCRIHNINAHAKVDCS